MSTKVGTVERLVAVSRDIQVARPTAAPEHPLGQPADDFETRRIDVKQGQLVRRQSGRAARDAVDKLRCIRAAPADDRDLDSHPLPDVNALTTLCCVAYKHMINRGQVL